MALQNASGLIYCDTVTIDQQVKLLSYKYYNFVWELILLEIPFSNNVMNI